MKTGVTVGRRGKSATSFGGGTENSRKLFDLSISYKEINILKISVKGKEMILF